MPFEKWEYGCNQIDDPSQGTPYICLDVLEEEQEYGSPLVHIAEGIKNGIKIVVCPNIFGTQCSILEGPCPNRTLEMCVIPPKLGKQLGPIVPPPKKPFSINVLRPEFENNGEKPLSCFELNNATFQRMCDYFDVYQQLLRKGERLSTETLRREGIEWIAYIPKGNKGVQQQGADKWVTKNLDDIGYIFFEPDEEKADKIRTGGKSGEKAEERGGANDKKRFNLATVAQTNAVLLISKKKTEK